jgi:hypothetical protein
MERAELELSPTLGIMRNNAWLLIDFAGGL